MIEQVKTSWQPRDNLKEYLTSRIWDLVFLSSWGRNLCIIPLSWSDHYLTGFRLVVTPCLFLHGVKVYFFSGMAISNYECLPVIEDYSINFKGGGDIISLKKRL